MPPSRKLLDNANPLTDIKINYGLSASSYTDYLPHQLGLTDEIQITPVTSRSPPPVSQGRRALPIRTRTATGKVPRRQSLLLTIPTHQDMA